MLLFLTKFDQPSWILVMLAGRYECTRGLIWVHVPADMGSLCEGCYGFGTLESLAVSARVTKHFVTIFSKTCNKT